MKYTKKTREFRLLSEFSKRWTTGPVEIEEVLAKVKDFNEKVNPRGFINDLEDNGFIIKNDNKITFINNRKGGDKMVNYSKQMTPGEEKVAKAIISYFEPGFKNGKPSEVVFKSCLKAALPSINKKVDERLAFKNLKDFNYIKVVDGKIELGVKGKEYLSL